MPTDPHDIERYLAQHQAAERYLAQQECKVAEAARQREAEAPLLAALEAEAKAAARLSAIAYTKAWRKSGTPAALAAAVRRRKARRDNLQARRPDKVRANKAVEKARKRARKYGAEGTFTSSEWLALQAASGHQCQACGAAECTVDHIAPLSTGGSNWLWNIQALCASCNARKRDRTQAYAAGALVFELFE